MLLDGGLFHSYAMVGLVIFGGLLLINITQSIIWYKIFKKKIYFFISFLFLLSIFYIFDLDVAGSVYIVLFIVSSIVLIILKNKKQSNENN